MAEVECAYEVERGNVLGWLDGVKVALGYGGMTV